MDERRMYLLEQEIKRLQGEHFYGEQIIILHINHFMQNSLLFNKLLQNLFQDIVFLGVPYHTQPGNWDRDFNPEYCCYYGRWEQDIFYMYRNHTRIVVYKGSFQQVCESMLNVILCREIIPAVRKGKKVLILEDGGYVSQYLKGWKERYPELKGKIIGSVEQTTSGTRLNKRYYDANGYDFPCISIARSDIKMDVEALFVCNRILGTLDYLLHELDTFLEFHQVLLLGYGILGRIIARLLKFRHVDFLVYDTDSCIRKQAEQDGCLVIDNVSQMSYQKDTVIIGVTGEEAFTAEMLESFLKSPAKRLYLASGSSKQTEFQVFLQYINQNNITRYSKLHPYLLPAKDSREEKMVYLLADGMPLNFYQSLGDSLTFSIIDLIFTEMLLCGCCLVLEQLAEKRMYLAGTDKIPEMDEKIIFENWCDIYGLWNKYPASHPEKNYLRRMIYDKGKS